MLQGIPYEGTGHSERESVSAGEQPLEVVGAGALGAVGAG